MSARETTMKAAMLSMFVLAMTFQSHPTGQGSGGAPEVLTNEAIISMTAANVQRDLLVAKLNTTKNTFDVSVNGLVTLYQGRVNQDVIKAMISAAANPKLGPPATKTPEVLDNQAVITMVTGKLPKSIIMVKIQNTKGTYDVSSSGLVSLTQAKVPSDVINAMMLKGGLYPG
jgi:hypothetical protein